MTYCWLTKGQVTIPGPRERIIQLSKYWNMLRLWLPCVAAASVFSRLGEGVTIAEGPLFFT